MDKEKRKEYYKKWCSLNKDKRKFYNKTSAPSKKKWYEANKEYHKKYAKKWYELNKERISKQKKDYKKENKAKIQIADKIYREKNKEKKNKSDRDRRAKDPIFKLRRNLSTLIRQAFKSSSLCKKSKTIKIIGCSFKELREHIEKQFESWMNWDNYGVYILGGPRTWNIDHIIPVASAKVEEDIIKLNHYTNLRPLCSKENNEKSNKII